MIVKRFRDDIKIKNKRDKIEAIDEHIRFLTFVDSKYPYIIQRLINNWNKKRIEVKESLNEYC